MLKIRMWGYIPGSAGPGLSRQQMTQKNPSHPPEIVVFYLKLFTTVVCAKQKDAADQAETGKFIHCPAESWVQVGRKFKRFELLCERKK
jgi:hypothetical protein